MSQIKNISVEVLTKLVNDMCRDTNDYLDEVTELCPHCQCETLVNIESLSKCTHCGDMIRPCAGCALSQRYSFCDFDDKSGCCRFPYVARDTETVYQYDELPQFVIEKIDELGQIESYEDCNNLQKLLGEINWTCDYDLSATPYDFRRI